MLQNLVAKALKFVYAGENERPVRAVNFRKRELGGIGLIDPIIKCKALLVKTMYKEYIRLNGDITDNERIHTLYGYPEEMLRVVSRGTNMGSSMEDELYRNNSLIPSRSEKRSVGVKWTVAWNNVATLRGLNPEQIMFAWKIQQDMLAIGARLHRRNVERRCMLKVQDEICEEVQTREHLFGSCKSVEGISGACKTVLNEFLGREVNLNDLIHLSFNHRDKRKLKLALWFAVKVMYSIYHDNSRNKAQILHEVVKEIDWNLDLSRKIGSVAQMIVLKQIINILGLTF